MQLQQTMATDLPLYHAILAPVFDSTEENAVIAIDITVRLTEFKPKAGHPLLTLPLKRGPTPTQRYDGDALKATDDSGPVTLSYTDTDSANVMRTWACERDSVGPIVVRLRAVPRQTDSKTPIGPRIDLRGDQGGAFAKGSGFLPYPPADEDWRVQLDWNLPDSAPPGTKAASSLGEGPSSSEVGRPHELIGNSIFAVGPLKRFPAEDSSAENGQSFAVYWVGSPPYDMYHIAPLTEKIFRSIAHRFGDTTNPFRVFIRRVWSGHGGTGAHRSFLLEYSPGTEDEEPEDALIDLLAHETVHEYPLMFPEAIDDAWYCEGVANYYATIAPFEAGVVDRQYLLRALNNQAQAYYTTDVINLEWKYITEHYWDRFDITKAGYGRGFIYLCQVHGLIQRATDGKKGVDEIVMALYQKQIRREEHHSNDFHELVSQIIGREETNETRAAMEGGKIIVPPQHCFTKYGVRLVRSDTERFEAGFDPNSLRKHRISGLVKDSRAEEAGIREDDEVVRSWMLWGAGDSLQNTMQVTVLRDGEEKVIKYWPRSYEKVEAWAWVED